MNVLTPSFVQELVETEGLDRISIRDSVLSPLQQDDVILRVRRNMHSYRVRNVDWRMYDFLKHFPGITPQTRKVVHDAAHLKTMTRRFLNVEATFASLEHYGGLSTRDSHWTTSFRTARALLEEELGHKMLSPLKLTPQTDINDIFSDKSTSAGAIGSGSKEDNWTQIKQDAMRMLSMIKSDVPFDSIFIPAMPFHRAQLKELITDDGQLNLQYEEKDRLVWGLDGASVAIESLFARPMIELTKDQWPGYAGGKVPATLRRSIRVAQRVNSHWYSTDYSKFDQTVPDWVIHQCFDIVRLHYPAKYKKLIDWCEYNFTNTVIVLPTGDCIRVHKGIPSGSNFTQLIGSMANYLMMMTYIAHVTPGKTVEDKIHRIRPQLRFSDDTRHTRMFVMGDDNLFFIEKELDVNDLADYVTHVFGVKVNGSKTVHGYHNHPEFLHRVWLGTEESRDQAEMLVNVIQPERPRLYNGYTPLEIMFSLFFTFQGAFDVSSGEMLRWFSKRFHDSGRNANTLWSLPKQDLPGSAKVFSKEARQQLVNAVESVGI